MCKLTQDLLSEELPVLHHLVIQHALFKEPSLLLKIKVSTRNLINQSDITRIQEVFFLRKGELH